MFYKIFVWKQSFSKPPFLGPGWHAQSNQAKLVQCELVKRPMWYLRNSFFFAFTFNLHDQSQIFLRTIFLYKYLKPSFDSKLLIGQILTQIQHSEVTALLLLPYEEGFNCFYGPSLCGKFMLKCCANRKEFMTIWQVGSIRITNNDKKDEAAILTDIPSNICYTTLQSVCK